MTTPDQFSTIVQREEQEALKALKWEPSAYEYRYEGKPVARPRTITEAIRATRAAQAATCKLELRDPSGRIRRKHTPAARLERTLYQKEYLEESNRRIATMQRILICQS